MSPSDKRPHVINYSLNLIPEILDENKNVEGTVLGAGKTEMNMFCILL